MKQYLIEQKEVSERLSIKKDEKFFKEIDRLIDATVSPRYPCESFMRHCPFWKHESILERLKIKYPNDEFEFKRNCLYLKNPNKWPGPLQRECNEIQRKRVKEQLKEENVDLFVITSSIDPNQVLYQLKQEFPNKEYEFYYVDGVITPIWVFQVKKESFWNKLCC
jgi:hypothetical protein